MLLWWVIVMNDCILGVSQIGKILEKLESSVKSSYITLQVYFKTAEGNSESREWCFHLHYHKFSWTDELYWSTNYSTYMLWPFWKYIYWSVIYNNAAWLPSENKVGWRIDQQENKSSTSEPIGSNGGLRRNSVNISAMNTVWFPKYVFTFTAWKIEMTISHHAEAYTQSSY
jgi:hypothetical protein